MTSKEERRKQLRKASATFRQTHPEKAKETCRKSYRKYIEKRKEYAREYRETNKEKVKEKDKKWRKNNLDKRNATSKTWYKQHRMNNPERAWATVTRASHKKFYTINITLDELEALAKQTPRCRYCNEKLNYKGKQGNKDKRKSASMDRKNGEKTLLINNVQILCAKCNAIKQDLTHEDFVEYCKMIAEKFKHK